MSDGPWFEDNGQGIIRHMADTGLITLDREFTGSLWPVGGLEAVRKAAKRLLRDKQCAVFLCPSNCDLRFRWGRVCKRPKDQPSYCVIPRPRRRARRRAKRYKVRGKTYRRCPCVAGWYVSWDLAAVDMLRGYHDTPRQKLGGHPKTHGLPKALLRADAAILAQYRHYKRKSVD